MPARYNRIYVNSIGPEARVQKGMVSLCASGVAGEKSPPYGKTNEQRTKNGTAHRGERGGPGTQ